MTWYPGQGIVNGNFTKWYGQGHQMRVKSNLLFPIGPVSKQNLTRYQAPMHDIIPKQSKLGDNWVGFGSGDSFVQVEDSGMGAYSQLPPWKQFPLFNFNNYNYTFKPWPTYNLYTPNSSDPSAFPEANATKWRCPGDPEGKSGKLCISGGTGVDGVYESSPLSPTHFDPIGALMQKHGVLVDSWPWAERPRHDWGRDAKDHYASPKVDQFDYDKAANPYWSFNNHAMRSLPEYKDPEGPANKQLMLGAFWNNTRHGIPDMEDSYVNNVSYALQLEVPPPPFSLFLAPLPLLGPAPLPHLTRPRGCTPTLRLV